MTFLTFLVGVIGGIVGATSKIALEVYKRAVEACAVASMIAAEIEATLAISENRRHVEFVTETLRAIESTGNIHTFGDIVGDHGMVNPVLEKNLDKLGMLGPDLCSRIALFYTNLTGIRSDLRRLAAGDAYTTADEQRRIIEEDLRLWSETVAIGRVVVAELKTFARTPAAHHVALGAWEVCCPKRGRKGLVFANFQHVRRLE
jgi:hypothetical protein